MACFTQRIARSARGPSVRTSDFRRCDKQLPWPWSITGGGNGTRVNSAGAIEAIGANSPRFDCNNVRTNLLTNSADMTNVSSTFHVLVSANQIAAPDGTMTADKAVADTTAATQHWCNKSITVAMTPGLTYTYSVYAKAAEYSRFSCFLPGAMGSAGATFNLSAVTSSATAGSSTITDVGNGWYRCTFTFAPTGVAGASIYIFQLADGTGAGTFTGDGVSGMYFWGWQLEVGAVATAYIPTGNAAVGVASPRGLLVEPASTNLLLQSAAFDNASWSKTNSTITADAITAPDGTQSADKLVESAVNAAHYVSQLYGGAADNTTYTSSCFLRAGERSGVEVSLQNKAGTFITAVVNLLTGAITPTVHPELGTWTCVSYGNGWWRVSATVNSSAGATTFLPLRVFLVSSSAYLGDGASGVYLWGAQLEVGSVATSYIPTAAATAPRAIEQVTCASLAQLGFNTAGFAFSIGWEHGPLASAAAWPNPIIFRDAGGANRLQLFFDNTNQLSIRVDSGGATLDQRVVATGIVPSTKHRAVVAVSPTGISVSVDGGAVTTYGVAVPLAAFTAVDLGGNAGAANNALNGWLRDYKDWPRLLSSDELIAESAVI